MATNSEKEFVCFIFDIVGFIRDSIRSTPVFDEKDDCYLK